MQLRKRLRSAAPCSRELLACNSLLISRHTVFRRNLSLAAIISERAFVLKCKKKRRKLHRGFVTCFSPPVVLTFTRFLTVARDVLRRADPLFHGARLHVTGYRSLPRSCENHAWFEFGLCVLVCWCSETPPLPTDCFQCRPLHRCRHRASWQ